MASSYHSVPALNQQDSKHTGPTDTGNAFCQYLHGYGRGTCFSSEAAAFINNQSFVKVRVESPAVWPTYFLLIDPVDDKFSLFANAMVVVI